MGAAVGKGKTPEWGFKGSDQFKMTLKKTTITALAGGTPRDCVCVYSLLYPLR